MTKTVNSTSLTDLLTHLRSETLADKSFVNKIEIGRDNKLSFEVVESTGVRWFRWDQDRAVELVISNDRKIPLAAHLKDEKFARSCQVLSYRPGRRLTLLDKSGHKIKVLKGFQKTRLAKMIANYEFAFKTFEGSGVNSPEIIEYDYEDASMIMAYKSGEQLRLSMDSSDLFHHAGQALRDFQDSSIENEHETFSFNQELKVIDKRALRLLKIGGATPAGWNALRKRIEQAAEGLPPAQLGPAHRDLHDKQFIQHQKFLTLLDFDLMCDADHAVDPANFLAHLVLRNLQGVRGASQKSINVCGKQFLLGLGRNEEPGFWESLRFFQATTFCRLALVYVLRPKWSHLVPDLMTMGNRCLDDLERIKRQ